MKQVLLKKGQVIIEEVPAPIVEEGTVLVQVAYSCISAGTEISGMVNSGEPLWKKAMRHPEKVKKVLYVAHAKGISSTIDNVKSQVYGSRQIGYSCSGTALEAGKNISDIKAGDRVACAGAGYANHAEIINVPRNLLVKVPKGVTLDLASTTTLGAISMQGVRRANPTLGEIVVVLGLGILGQLTAQLLLVNGCRVVGIDIDKGRVELAKSLGMDMGICTTDEDEVQKVFQFTEGFGADAVIVTAATKSDEVISKAFQMCRKKGRVVLVGDVGLNIRRSDIYTKELDFFISTSYGPGRYEPNYEEKGLDYPIGYVRWTENRNMAEYLKLVAEFKIQVNPLISKEYPIEKANEAYRELKESQKKPLMVLLKYSPIEDQKEPNFTRKIEVTAGIARKQGRINVAIIGAGSFAKGVHLPNLRKLDKEFSVHAVMSRTGTNAKAIASQFKAAYATTNYKEILADEDVDAVFICTRHNLHGRMVIDALKAGKHVFVEKPLCIKREELDAIRDFYSSHATDQSLPPLLMVGFNRRFSKCAREAKKHTDKRINPLFMHYRMNAGYIPLTHWVHTEEGGGRIIGEACHIIDLFTFFTECKLKEIYTSTLIPKTGSLTSDDNRVIVLNYEDGSVATLEYFAIGSKEFPKEYMEIHFDERTIVIDDYKSIKGHGVKLNLIKSKIPEKGHLEELEALYDILTGKTERWPIELWDMIQTTEISFEIEKCK